MGQKTEVTGERGTLKTGELLLMNTDDEEVLKMNDGNGCTINLVTLKYTFKYLRW